MLHQWLLLVVLILGSVSTGFTQSLGDLARAERARREVLSRSATSPDIPAVSAGREALVKEALHVSGATRQLEQVLETSLPSVADGKPPEGVSVQEYQRIINEIFAVEYLTRVMGKSVSDTVNDKTLIEIVRWYRSPLGKKIAMAEIDATGPEAPARLQHYASMLQSNAPSSNRQGLVSGITAAALGVPRPSSHVEKTLGTQVTESSGQGTSLWFLFAYNSLSEAELSEYLMFLKSPSATAFNNSVWDGIDATFGDAAQRFGRKLAERKSSHSN
jgi:hypothetical protein